MYTKDTIMVTKLNNRQTESNVFKGNKIQDQYLIWCFLPGILGQGSVLLHL